MTDIIYRLQSMAEALARSSVGMPLTVQLLRDATDEIEQSRALLREAGKLIDRQCARIELLEEDATELAAKTMVATLLKGVGSDHA